MNNYDAIKHEDQKEIYDLIRSQARKRLEDAYTGYKQVAGLNISDETKMQFFERFIGMKHMYQDLFPGEYVEEHDNQLEYTSCIVTLPEASKAGYINTLRTLGLISEEQIDTSLDDLISEIKDALGQED